MITSSEIAPCKNCPDRHVACHDSCGRYKKWIAAEHELKAKKKAMRKDMQRQVYSEIRNSGKKIVPPTVLRR